MPSLWLHDFSICSWGCKHVPPWACRCIALPRPLVEDAWHHFSKMHHTSCGAVQEHEASLKAFQRALHLAPNFTYAVTLAGHEYFANEDLEKSTHCYQAAIRLDRRHYNAWCRPLAVENDYGSWVAFKMFSLVVMS